MNDFVSFAILGFSFGGFILSFNLYTYILHGFRFPFIATLNRPFLKFSLNNFIIPAAYLVTYIWCSVQFHLNEELIPFSHVFYNILGLFFGMFIFLIISILYFTITNKNAGAILGKKEEGIPVQTNLLKKKDWVEEEKKASDWRVETYLVHWFKIGIARSSRHYKREILEKVFAQNHVNASLFEIGVLVSFIVVGSFREMTLFIIPAAASVTLFFTVSLMLISALFSWIKGWTFSVFIILFILINFSFSGLEVFNLHSGAYGMDYEQEPAEYSPEYIKSINLQASIAEAAKNNTIDILEKWKAKNTKGDELPKMVIINTSGGGLRSALWSTSSLMRADSICEGELLNHTVLMTGSSGGMIGSSLVRESMLEDQKEAITQKEHQISSDLLNPVMLTIATNDLFIRYQKFEEGNSCFTKDRAYAFEKQLNSNTNGVFDKSLGDYTKEEAEANIPLMVLAPSIVNDGRRLVISATPMSYLCQNGSDQVVNGQMFAEDIEFQRFFAEQDALNLKWSSALRMNATFPYVLPVTSLPSEPQIGVMDAGLRDNFGLKTTYQFLYTFKDWINENTSGVVILQVRDIQKKYVGAETGRSLVSKFTAPLGSVYGNVTKTHNYNQDQMLRYLADDFDQPVEVVTFQLQSQEDKPLSLSWHLTKKERLQIITRSNGMEFKEKATYLKELL